MKIIPTYRIEPRPLDYVDIRLEAEEARLLHEQLFAVIRFGKHPAMLIHLESTLGEAIRGELK